MPCYDGYIEIDRSTTSRSGLYASDLPGVEISMYNELIRDSHVNRDAFHQMILRRAWTNLISDVSIALQNKFFVDSKILARETSKFKEAYNSATGLAGIKFEFDLPKYARVHILSVDLFSESAYQSPDTSFYIHEEDADGELLFETAQTLTAGRNTIYIDRDFEVDKLFIAYDADEISAKETENRYYDSFYNSFDKVECIFPCAGSSGYQGKVTQFNGGGLNVKFTIVCSIEKFVCENLNLFKTAFWYRYGVELMDEALLGSKLSKFTTMTAERALDRSGYFGTKYTSNIGEAIKSQNIDEDPICFKCKNTVHTKNLLP
jgi:hypothetical protein